MEDAITSLGPDGFDGAYVQNDEMMTGALQAMEEAGLDPYKYWLGSSNGKEKSWDWVAKGETTMDVDHAPPSKEISRSSRSAPTSTRNLIKKRSSFLSRRSRKTRSIKAK